MQTVEQPDFVEAEIVYDGDSSGRGERPFERPFERPAPRPEAPGLFTRFKRMIAGILGLLGAILVIPGMILTSTIIGAIIGIPLLIVGFALLFLAFKLAFSGSQNAFVFRKFP